MTISSKASKNSVLRLWAAATLTLTALPVSAQSLNEQIISQFAQTFDPVAKRIVAVDAEFDPFNLTGLTSQLEQMVAADGPESARDKAVALHGYGDFETWAKTAVLIIRAAQWAKDPLDQADFEAAAAQVNANSELSAGNKQAMISELKKSFEEALKQKPDQADIDLAKRLLPLLEPVLWPNN